jgi:hypothetical protein
MIWAGLGSSMYVYYTCPNFYLVQAAGLLTSRS